MWRALKILLVVCWIGTTQFALAQQPNRPELQRVEKAFSEADVDALSNMSADRVEIAVFGRSRLYSRSQARFILKELFDQYPPMRFELSAPSQTEKGLFAAGSYRYSMEQEPLRVYVRLRKSGESWSLREILVDRSSQ